MLCEKCIHYEFVKTNASTYCLCSEAFNFKEKLRHNPEEKCNYFKDRAFFNPPLNNNCSKDKTDLGFPAFLITKNIKEGKEFSEYYLSCKYGTVNPFSLGLWGRGNDGWYRIDEFYYSPQDNGIQLTDEEYYTKLKEFCGDRKIAGLIIEPSAASFIETVIRHNEIPVIKADINILKGIDKLCSLFEEHKIFISPKCINTIREFSTFSWNNIKNFSETKNNRTISDIIFFINEGGIFDEN